MFTPGDYVVYSIEGVCRVEEAGRLNVPGLERGRDYYRLTPYYRGGVIYTPVGGKASIRPVMTKTDVQALLPQEDFMLYVFDLSGNYEAAVEQVESVLEKMDATVSVDEAWTTRLAEAYYCTVQ